MIDMILSIPKAEVLSFVGLALITFAFLPQSIKTLRSGDTKAISLKMYIMYPAGCITMLFLGLEIDNISMVIWEAIATLLSLTITFIKAKNVLQHNEGW